MRIQPIPPDGPAGRTASLRKLLQNTDVTPVGNLLKTDLIRLAHRITTTKFDADGLQDLEKILGSLLFEIQKKRRQCDPNY